MKVKVLLCGISFILLAGCGDSKKFEVNDEHCKPAYYQQMEKSAQRDALVKGCMSR